jgi:hypothetical protein
VHFLDENTPLWGLTSPRGDAKSKRQKKKAKDDRADGKVLIHTLRNWLQTLQTIPYKG